MLVALRTVSSMAIQKRIALITGASVGIGAATARSLNELGFSLILVARRQEKLDSLNKELGGGHHVITCDVTDHAQMTQALNELPPYFQNIDVLVNNAGLALGLEPGYETKWEHWETMIQTNCIALAFLTRQILPEMVGRNKGHIINIGSIAGTYAYKGGNVYGASKAFVEHFTLGLRADLIGTSIKVTNLEPGLIGGTEFSDVRYEGDQNKVGATYENCQPMRPEDIAETISWLVQQPPHLNVNRMELMPVCQAPGGVLVHKN